MLNNSLENRNLPRALLLFKFTFGDRPFEGLEIGEFLFDFCERCSITITIEPVTSLGDEDFEFLALFIARDSAEERVLEVVPTAIGECLKFVAGFFQGATVTVECVETLNPRLNFSFPLS